MRKYTFLVSLFALAALLTFSNCNNNKGTEKTEAEKQLDLLAGTWNISTATLDGTDVLTDYSGMTLTLTTSKGYSTSGGDFAPVWPSSGTFDFNSSGGTEDLNTLVRDDNVEMSISNISESNLSLSFDYAVSPPCRTKGVCGGYTFTFTK